MNGWFLEDFVRDRNAGIVAEAQEHNRARAIPRRPRASLRALAARALFGFAVALEREETWRVVWERLEAPRRA